MIIKDLKQEYEGTIKEFGDFQTPESLAKRVCELLVHKKINPSFIVEPTCGEGNFIVEAMAAFPNVKKIYGVEIQKHYIEKCYQRICRQPNKDIDVTLFHSNFFEHDFSDLKITKDTLIIGNPPWATAAELSEKTGWNLPVKRNIKSLSGIDAVTGKGNFDITEAMLITLLDKMEESKSGMLAMLCKKSVVKNLLEYQKIKNWSIAEFEAYEFNAKKEFNVVAEAALLYVRFEETVQKAYQCRYYSLYKPDVLNCSLGWAGENFVSNIEAYRQIPDLDGISEFEWRSGIKHDCAKVMELKNVKGLYMNGYKETVDIEDELVFSLMKSSDVANKRIEKIGQKKLIVTQKAICADTSHIEEKYPKLWKYLVKHADKLDGRKSAIYKNCPRFSIFGVGEYSFTDYKIAISSMYKKGDFLLVGPDRDNKPVVFDDTCYFLSFDNYKDAAMTISILNHELVRAFLQNIIFRDSQRPYTKQVLMRINFRKAIAAIGAENIIASVNEQFRLGLSERDFQSYLEIYIYPNNKNKPL